MDMGVKNYKEIKKGKFVNKWKTCTFPFQWMYISEARV